MSLHTLATSAAVVVLMFAVSGAGPEKHRDKCADPDRVRSLQSVDDDFKFGICAARDSGSQVTASPAPAAYDACRLEQLVGSGPGVLRVELEDDVVPKAHTRLGVDTVRLLKGFNRLFSATA
jgi:hypothetical protein